MAAAAAMAGERRWVRPPRPWRPSKLRLLVEAQRSPGCEDVGVHAEAHGAAGLAPLEAGGLEDDGRGLLASAWLLTACEPGTTMARTVVATWWPRTILAAARRSSMRPLVQEPRKTASTLMSSIGVPGLRPMYSRARAKLLLVGFGEGVVGRGDLAVDGGDHAGGGAPGDGGGELGGVDGELAVEGGAVSVTRADHCWHGEVSDVVVAPLRARSGGL